MSISNRLQSTKEGRLGNLHPDWHRLNAMLGCIISARTLSDLHGSDYLSALLTTAFDEALALQMQAMQRVDEAA